MTKHVLTYAFLCFFTHFASAQLTLQQVDGTKKHVISGGTSIDMTFPIKTSGLPEKAAQIYKGRLKNADNRSIGVVMTYENRYYVDENGVTIQEYRNINPPDTPIIVQIPLTKMQSIVQRYPKNLKLSNAGGYLMLAAILSNIFIAPHLKEPHAKTVRNAGFVTMSIGLSCALIPTKKTYYLEQPKNGNKKLWKILSN